MTQTLQNLLIILGILIVGALGWYMYSETSQRALDINGSSSVQANIQTYRQQQATLRALSLDVEILSQPEFRALRSVTEPVPQLPQGRANPFFPN